VAQRLQLLKGMLDRDKVFAAFRLALSELGAGGGTEGVRPRAVALRAHVLYCADLKAHEKRPVPETFRKFATGQLPFPEIVELLKDHNIHTTVRSRLDRERLRSVFEEAIQRLESRLIRGQARPLQIARRAHELYGRDLSGAKPSHYTFERLIYGKAADPEIVTMIETALHQNKSKREDGAA